MGRWVGSYARPRSCSGDANRRHGAHRDPRSPLRRRRRVVCRYGSVRAHRRSQCKRPTCPLLRSGQESHAVSRWLLVKGREDRRLLELAGQSQSRWIRVGALRRPSHWCAPGCVHGCHRKDPARHRTGSHVPEPRVCKSCAPRPRHTRRERRARGCTPDSEKSRAARVGRNSCANPLQARTPPCR